MSISFRQALAVARFSEPHGTVRVLGDLQAAVRDRGCVRLRPMIERMSTDPGMSGWRAHAVQEHANEEYSDHVQGIACDGASWYIAQDDGGDDRGVYQFSLDFRQQTARWRPGRAYGDHLGDISCGVYRGQPCIYVPYENTPTGYGRVVVLDSRLAVVDAQYLEASDGGPPPTGGKAPWIGYNPLNGLVYTSEYDAVVRLEAYDPSHGFRHVPGESIVLEQTCHMVQGGTFNASGHVFLSCAETPKIFGFSAFTGALLGTVSFALSTGEGEVVEGICWAPLMVNSQRCGLHLVVHDWDVVEDDLFIRHFVTGTTS